MAKSKKIKSIISLVLTLILVLTLHNCERDDICAEGTSTTPRLIIEFYDNENPENLKNVPRLSVYGESLFLDNDGNLVPPEEVSDGIVEYDDIPLFDINRSEIGLPLLIENEGTTVTTRFVLEQFTNLRLDEDTSSDSNIDIIEISYTPEFEYVSRACGYKSVFKGLNVTEVNDDDNWISNIEIDAEDIENENTVHVRIFH